MQPSQLLQKLKLYKYEILLALLCLFHFIVNLIWQRLNTAPPTWDSAGHLALAYIFSDRFLQLIRGEIPFSVIMVTSTYYPPLIHILGAFIFLIFGRNYEIPLFLMGTSALIIAAVYLYGTVLFISKNKLLALLSAVTFTLFPHVWQQSRDFHLDLPLTASLVASYYYLVRSDTFKDKKRSIQFFVCFSIGQLIKWYAFVYLLVPFLAEALFKSIKNRDLRNRSRLVNILKGFYILIIIASAWYFYNLKTIVENVKISITPDAGDPRILFSYQNLTHYLMQMPAQQIGAISFVLVIAGLAVMFKKTRWSFIYAVLLIGIPYLVFTFIGNKDLRYILPLTLPFAYLVAYFLFELGAKLLAAVSGAFYVIVMLCIFFFLSFNQYMTLPENLKWVGFVIAGPYNYIWIDESWTYAYNAQNWQGNDMLVAVQKLADEQGVSSGHYKVLELADNRFYSTASFDLYKLQNRFSLMDFVEPYYKFDAFTPQGLKDYLSQIQYALVPDDPGPPGLRNIIPLKQLVSYFKSSENTGFMPVEEFKLPDGNVITLYKRNMLSTIFNPTIKDNSLVVRIGDILWLNREKIGKTSFDIVLTKEDGTVDTVTFDGDAAEKRVALDGVRTVKVGLPPEEISIEQTQGWIYNDNGLVRDDQYAATVASVNREFAYNGSTVTPNTDIFTVFNLPTDSIEYNNGTITVTLNSTQDETSYVAYATQGWEWKGVTLSSKEKTVSIPVEGLMQLEVTSKSQLIKGFPTNWGYFVCYSGNAICYYPLIDIM